MSGQILTASTGGLGVALLPNTGSTRPLFYAAAVLLLGGLVTLAISLALKSKAN